MGGVDKKNDKIFKKILSDETEMAVFLCQFLKLKIKPNELEKYKNSFITQNINPKNQILYINTKIKMFIICQNSNQKQIKICQEEF